MSLRENGSKALAVTALLVLGLLGGCGDDNGTKPSDNDPGGITFPLRVGNQWTYVVARTGIAGKDSADTRTDRVVGTVELGSKSYFLITSDDGADSSYVRQEEQGMYIWIPFRTSGPADPADSALTGQLLESMPWKAADFSAAQNTSWQLASATWEESQFSVSLKVTATSLGRTRVSVPSGDYEDVYRGRIALTQTVTVFMQIPVILNGSTVQELYIKNGVGIVQQDTRLHQDRVEGGPIDSSSQDQLKSYQLEP